MGMRLHAKSVEINKLQREAQTPNILNKTT